MRKFISLCIVLLGTAFLTAHPHFRKTVSVELPGGVEATISYQTTPANESHVEMASAGAFLTPRRPLLTLSGALSMGSMSIPQGEYTIGVIKNGARDFTMALHPGRLGRGDTPDMSKVIKLDSIFSDSEAMAEHLIVDIRPGHDRFEGKPVLVLLFGSLSLESSLS